MTAPDPGLVQAVADAISRNDCRRYEIEHAHTGDKCPAAIAALAVAYPIIEAQVRAEVIHDLRAHLRDLGMDSGVFSRGKRAGLRCAIYIAGNELTDTAAAQ